LIRDSRSTTGDGVPLLRRIPVLGNLFGTTDKSTTRTELIILLTPHVIRSDTESEEVMTDLEREFRGLRSTMPDLLKSSGSSAQAAPAAAH
jgi:general secretion pathway protein D